MRLVAMALFLGVFSDTVSAAPPECHITLEQYHKIQIGMTMEDISKIVPCPGQEVFDLQMSGGSRSTDYRWSGARGSAYVTISEGRVTEVKHYGLANE